jgi:hypothetical protein
MVKRDWSIDLQRYRRKGAECNLGKLRCDAQGCVYIADPIEKAVHKFDSDGNFLLRFSGRGGRRLGYPLDASIDARGNVFVADPGLGRVVRFDSSGRCESSFAPEVRPLRMAIDEKGFLYLHAPTPQGVLHKYTSRGKKLLSFGCGPNRHRRGCGREAMTKRQLDYPDYLNDVGSVEVDLKGRPYYAPRRIYNVQRFNRAGQLHTSFHRRIREAPVTVLVDGKRDVAWTDVILDIAVSSKRNGLYVLRARLRDGHSVVDAWSGTGEYRGEIVFDHPALSIACDRNENMYLLFTNIARGIAGLLKYSLTP